MWWKNEKNGFYKFWIHRSNKLSNNLRYQHSPFSSLSEPLKCGLPGNVLERARSPDPQETGIPGGCKLAGCGGIGMAGGFACGKCWAWTCC